MNVNVTCTEYSLNFESCKSILFDFIRSSISKSLVVFEIFLGSIAFGSFKCVKVWLARLALINLIGLFLFTAEFGYRTKHLDVSYSLSTSMYVPILVCSSS